MTESDITVRSPAKIILFGEHAVVYGKQAIAASVGLYTICWLKQAGSSVRLRLPEIHVDVSFGVDDLKEIRVNASSESTSKSCFDLKRAECQ